MTLKKICVLVLSISLASCFQVQLLGPVAGAHVEIYQLPDLSTPVYTGSSTNMAPFLALPDFQELPGSLLLSWSGLVGPNELAVEEGAWYLVVATQGTDVDSNSDGVLDSTGQALTGTLRALVPANRMEDLQFRLSIITELTYQVAQLTYDLEQPIDSMLLQLSLNSAAAGSITADITGDDSIDYDDLLDWDIASNREAISYDGNNLDQFAQFINTDTLDDFILTLYGASQ